MKNAIVASTTLLADSALAETLKNSFTPNSSIFNFALTYDNSINNIYHIFFRRHFYRGINRHSHLMTNDYEKNSQISRKVKEVSTKLSRIISFKILKTVILKPLGNFFKLFKLLQIKLLSLIYFWEHANNVSIIQALRVLRQSIKISAKQIFLDKSLATLRYQIMSNYYFKNRNKTYLEYAIQTPMKSLINLQSPLCRLSTSNEIIKFNML